MKNFGIEFRFVYDNDYYLKTFTIVSVCRKQPSKTLNRFFITENLSRVRFSPKSVSNFRSKFRAWRYIFQVATINIYRNRRFLLGWLQCQARLSIDGREKIVTYTEISEFSRVFN